MPLGMEVGLSPWEFVFDGDPAPPQKGPSPPIFGPCLLRPNGCTDQDAIWYGDRHRRRQDCVRWGPSSPPQKGAEPPPIFGPFYCGQTAGCIKMPLGMEVGLGQATLMGTQLPPEKRVRPPPPNFWPMSIVAKRLDG